MVKIGLGDKVRDRISGFTGIAIARTEWLYGCVRIGISPLVLKDNTIIDPCYIDEQQLEVIETGAIEYPGQELMESGNTPGPAGPRCDPPAGRPGE